MQRQRHFQSKFKINPMFVHQEGEKSFENVQVKAQSGTIL